MVKLLRSHYLRSCNMKIKDIIYSIVIAIIVAMLLFGNKNEVVLSPIEPSKQEIQIAERIIERNTIEVVNQKVLALKERELIDALNLEVRELRSYLESIRDTSSLEVIVDVQDTIIVALNEENEGLYSLVSIKDSVISLQDEIIGAKDVVIASKDAKIKKLKRQRNIAVGVAIAEGVIIGGILLKK